MAATYKVVVSKKVWPPDVPKVSPEQMIETMPEADRVKETTPFEFDIPKGGDKHIQIELKSRP